jgi:hypothetical protein
MRRGFVIKAGLARAPLDEILPEEDAVKNRKAKQMACCSSSATR